MDLGVKPPGTNPDATHASILAEELEKLKTYKLQLKSDNAEYINSHPELRVIIDNFVGDVLLKRPSDIIKFGCQYFNQMRNPNMAGPTPIVFAGELSLFLSRICSKFRTFNLI